MEARADLALLEASHTYCHRQTKRHARSFYFASVALPRDKKRAAYAVYAFCRYADDLVDTCRLDRGRGPGAAERVGEEFDRLAGRRALQEPPFAPRLRGRCNVSRSKSSRFVDLLKGVAMDLGPVKIADWPELREYCYHVASVVGLMMARIFELRDDAGRECAIDLGLAMQLTNILRDVGEDHRMGRTYLPADEMAAHGVTPEDLAAAKTSPALKTLLRAYRPSERANITGGRRREFRCWRMTARSLRSG